MRRAVAICPDGHKAGGDQMLLQLIDQTFQSGWVGAATSPEQLIVWPETQAVERQLEWWRFETGSEFTEFRQGKFGHLAEKSQRQVNGVHSGDAAAIALGGLVRHFGQRNS